MRRTWDRSLRWNWRTDQTLSPKFWGKTEKIKAISLILPTRTVSSLWCLSSSSAKAKSNISKQLLERCPKVQSVLFRNCRAHWGEEISQKKEYSSLWSSRVMQAYEFSYGKLPAVWQSQKNRKINRNSGFFKLAVFQGAAEPQLILWFSGQFIKNSQGAWLQEKLIYFVWTTIELVFNKMSIRGLRWLIRRGGNRRRKSQKAQSVACSHR